MPAGGALSALSGIELPDVTIIGEQLLGSPLTAIPVIFGAGVLTSLTPCIYPMIPITAAIVGGATLGGRAPARAGRWRGLALSLAYAAGLALVYSALGLAAGLTGTLFGAVASNPWLQVAMANVLLVAALAMLDVLPVRLPAVVERASAVGGAGLGARAFTMGAASGAVAAPCSAPVLAVVLTWVATTRSALLGFTYLLAFALGMCTLLVVVGVSAGALGRLPRAGRWMVWLKRGFAAVMLGAAEYYLLQAGQGIV